MLGKMKELYLKEMLNMLGMTKILLLTSTLMNVMVLSICSIVPNEHHHYFLMVLLMMHWTLSCINLKQMNSRLIDRCKKWTILLRKELKSKKKSDFEHSFKSV